MTDNIGFIKFKNKDKYGTQEYTKINTEKYLKIGEDSSLKSSPHTIVESILIKDGMVYLKIDTRIICYNRNDVDLIILIEE